MSHKYTEFINAAKQAGYNAVIIDSLSHLWQSILDEKAAIADHIKPVHKFASWVRANFMGHVLERGRPARTWVGGRLVLEWVVGAVQARRPRSQKICAHPCQF